jgi:HEAT repeat protein
LVGCDATPERRRASIYELKADPTAANLTKIRALLADGDRDVRATALHALADREVPDAAPLAATALDDPDGFVRATAARILGEVGDASHVEPLAKHVRSDPDPIARQRAAESLTQLGGTAAIAALIEALSDPMDRVRLAALQGLRQHDTQPALEQLAALLLEDDSWEVRSQAAAALGESGRAEALPALIEAAEDPHEFVRAAATRARGAIEAAGMVNEQGGDPVD